MNEKNIPTGNQAADAPPPLSLGGAIGIWCALIVLTAVTVVVARMHLGAVSIVAALTVATVKAGLVLTFFMGLRHESRVFWLMLLAAVVTVATIVGLTFLDILFR